MLKILAFDLSSGESGTQTAINAAVDFLNENNDWKIKGFANEIIDSNVHDRLELIKVKDVIGPEDGVLEVRRNPDTTLVQAIQCVIDGKADGVVSAAPSGPIVAAGYLMSKSIEGLKPAFTAQLNGVDGKLRVILDVGANLNVDSKTLNQYATMGSEYAKAINLSDNPSVFQLNIGTEIKKGKDLQKDAYKLMAENKHISFKGNIESNDVFSDSRVEVLVTDAYSGNIMLKSYEGAIFSFKNIIKSSVKKSPLDALGFLIAHKFKKEIKKGGNSNAGGAIILGLNHLILKVHGRAEQDWLFHSLYQIKGLIEKDLIKNIKENV